MTTKQVAEALNLSEREVRAALPGDVDVATLEDQLLEVESAIEACDAGPRGSPGAVKPGTI